MQSSQTCGEDRKQTHLIFRDFVSNFPSPRNGPFFSRYTEMDPSWFRLAYEQVQNRESRDGPYRETKQSPKSGVM